MRAPTDVSTGFESKNPSAHRAHPVKSHHTKCRHMSKLKMKRNGEIKLGSANYDTMREQKKMTIRIKTIRRSNKQKRK